MDARDIKDEVNGIKAEAIRRFPQVPKDILHEALAVAAAKMLVYEMTGKPQDEDYIFLLLPDVIKAVELSRAMRTDARVKIMAGKAEEAACCSL